MSVAARREAAKAAAEEKARQAEARAAAVSRERTEVVLHDIDEACEENN